MENNINQENNISEKYQIKSEIEHIISRPGMYIGSTATDVIEYALFVPSKNKIQTLQNIGYNAGLLKLVDEPFSNSIDEFRRKDSLFKISKINITINSDGFCCIEDDGGIPVSIHKSTGLLIPELIFGTLRSSSNYDDSQSREVVGTNGIGSKISNIFSTKFIVETADGKNSIKIEWSENMKEKVVEKIIPTTKHYTKISFYLDLNRFELDVISLHTARILQKRAIEAAAVNHGLIINFKSDLAEEKLNSTWSFDSFKEYVQLFLDEKQIPHLIEFNHKRDNIIIIPENIGFDLAFVNGVSCNQGTHVKKIQTQLVEKILEICKATDMELITERDIINRMSICINTNIVNPEYDSQSKTKLTNKIDKFHLNLTKEFLDKLKDSEIYKALKDFYEIKYAEIKKKELRKLNETIKATKTKKLISCASKDPNSNELWLFEGNSASNGFRHNRNLFQSAYLLRGKITNTFNLSRSQILENIELREVTAALGILFNEPQKNVKNCNYAKIVIASDMDYDGHHICGLLLAFFGVHFPELFKSGRIYRALSPIVICTKGTDKKYYYNHDEYEKDINSLKGYDILYTKGLGGLADEDYREMLRNQKLIQFSLNDIQDIEAIKTWFDKATDQRKELILQDEGGND